MDAFSRSVDAGDPIRANMSVQAYIPTRRITAMTARMRFMFCIVKILSEKYFGVQSMQKEIDMRIPVNKYTVIMLKIIVDKTF